MMDRLEKNRLLLEFCGFKSQKLPGIFWAFPGTDTYYAIEPPDFFDPEHGICACFKWLVPKLDSVLLMKITKLDDFMASAEYKGGEINFNKSLPEAIGQAAQLWKEGE